MSQLNMFKKVISISRDGSFGNNSTVLRNGWGKPTNQNVTVSQQAAGASAQNDGPIQAA